MSLTTLNVSASICVVWNFVHVTLTVPAREETFREVVKRHEEDEHAHRAKLRRGATLFVQKGLDLDLVQYVASNKSSLSPY